MTNDYTATITVDRSPHEAYLAVTDARTWWMADLDGRNEEVYESFTPGKHFCKCVSPNCYRPEELFVGTVVESEMTFVEDAREWVGTEMVFDFVPTNTGTTELHFTHVGLVPQIECFEICWGAWRHYFGGSLVQRLTDGVGTPHSQSDESQDADLSAVE